MPQPSVNSGVVYPNLIRNPNILGGSPGTPPTYWSTTGAGTGLTITWVGGGTDPILNQPYFDINVNGTATTGTVVNVLVDDAAPLTALYPYTASMYVSYSAGTLAGINSNATFLDVDESTSTGGYLTTYSSSSFTLTTAPTRKIATATTVATAAQANVYLSVGYATSTAINCTFRISVPSLYCGSSIGGDAYYVRGVRCPGGGTTRPVLPIPVAAVPAIVPLVPYQPTLQWGPLLAS